MKKRPLFELAVLLAFVALFVLAWAMVAGYSASGIGWNKPISLLSAARLASLATLEDMKETFDWDPAPWPWYLAGFLLAFCTILATIHKPLSWLRAAALGLQIMIVWPGWAGLYALPFNVVAIVIGRLDTEWLSEAWPPAEIAGLWLVASVLLCRSEVNALDPGTGPQPAKEGTAAR